MAGRGGAWRRLRVRAALSLAGTKRGVLLRTDLPDVGGGELGSQLTPHGIFGHVVP